MTDYISRADAIEALRRSSVYAWSTEQDLVAHSWAIRILQSLTSADAVGEKENDGFNTCNNNNNNANADNKPHGMSDLISRADAIDAVMKHHDGGLNQINYGLTLAKNEIQALPSADAVEVDRTSEWVAVRREEYEDLIADAEPKWNCTATFIAEQLDRLRKMTDEEKWEFFKRFFEIKGGDTE